MEVLEVVIALIIGLLILAVIMFISFKGFYQIDNNSTQIVNKTINENLGLKGMEEGRQSNIYIQLTLTGNQDITKRALIYYIT